MLDTIIKDGEVYDGSGAASRRCDVGIKNDRIVAVGDITESANQVIDAEGAIVTPAWVDIHTHYDGQVTWDSAMDPSASHGVGTVVMGNCGVGFAPVAPNGEQDLIDLMEGVEDIPGTALHEGMPWGAWETYPEYLNFLAERNYALNISSLCPHGAVRNYVMGERGRANEAATEDDLAAMSNLVEEALNAGAVGFSTSRILGHRSIHGEPVPGTFANDAEVMSIAHAMRRADRGVFQIIPSSTLGPGRPGMNEHASLADEIKLIANVSRTSGRPATFTLFQIDDWAHHWREALDQVKAANVDGAQIYPQVGSRPTGLVFCIDTYHPWMLKPTFKRLKNLSPTERRRRLQEPAIKAALLNETSDLNNVQLGSMAFALSQVELNFANIFALHGRSSYEPTRDESFAAMAARRNVTPAELLYDHLTATPANMSITFFTNYSEYHLDAVHEMQLDPCTVTGLSDAGAHVSLIFDAVNPTYQLTYWSRDRLRGNRLPLSHVIHRATQRNARLFGFADRGLLAPGMKADINLIDYDLLSLGELNLCRDLPAGGTRLLQNAIGYVGTWIDGVRTRRDDADTGARPGRLLRS